jgi:hypothetical protein
MKLDGEKLLAAKRSLTLASAATHISPTNQMMNPGGRLFQEESHRIAFVRQRSMNPLTSEAQFNNQNLIQCKF